MCLVIGTPKIIKFLIVPNGKLFVFGFSKCRHVTDLHNLVYVREKFIQTIGSD